MLADGLAVKAQSLLAGLEVCAQAARRFGRRHSKEIFTTYFVVFVFIQRLLKAYKTDSLLARCGACPVAA